MSSQEISITKEDLKNFKEEITHEWHACAAIISGGKIGGQVFGFGFSISLGLSDDAEKPHNGFSR